MSSLGQLQLNTFLSVECVFASLISVFSYSHFVVVVILRYVLKYRNI